jgi:arylsulfatase A-like enzyme
MNSLRVCAALLLAMLPGGNGAVAAPLPKPNLVYILADDLGYGDVQCLNPVRGKIPTPHLDRLATQGMTFTDAHSGSSVCSPTRYGLLTGRYAWRTRLQQGVLEVGNDEPLIAPDRLTLPALLRAQGYATACIGKWHLGFTSDSPPGNGWAGRGPGKDGLPLGARIQSGPTERGFDLFWGISHARTMVSLHEGDRVTALVEPVDLLPRLTQRAVDYLDAQAAAARSGRPFFLYVALTSPHTPIVPSAEWKGKSPLGLYSDFVMQTDDTVGRILSALDRHGLAANTLVVFASDNGCAPQAGIEKLEAQGHFASAQYRGYKADIWDGGHRVPCFVRWPGVVRPGSISDATIGLFDFMATVADLLGVQLPPAAAPDSVSFLPALRGAPMPSAREAIVHHSKDGVFALRQGPWKLILSGGSGGYGKPSHEEAARQGLPDAQLYNLAADSGETTNLVTTHLTEAARLLALLRSYVERGRSTPGAPQTNDVAIKLPAPSSVALR